MIRKNLFEYPLPVLKTEIEKLALNISNLYDGIINIENTGGGILAGQISANFEYIMFEPSDFEGNSIQVKYNINVSNYSKQDKIQFNIIISSSGGEKIIPVFINKTEDCFIMPDNTKINTLKEFLNYSKDHPLDSRRILGDSEFIFWLKRLEFEHMDILEHLVNDSNKERALDNFFVLSGLKKKADIIPVSKKFEIRIPNTTNEIIDGDILIKKVGWGYINANICLEGNPDWLTLSTNKITSKNFGNSDEFIVHYFVNTALIQNAYQKAKIIFEYNKIFSVDICVTKACPIKIKLSKECFDFNDKGTLVVENYSYEKILIELDCKDNFIKFEKDFYSIFGKTEIPFYIKLTALAKTQMDLTKKPVIKSMLNIQTTVKDKSYTHHKEIIIGNNF